MIRHPLFLSLLPLALAVPLSAGPGEGPALREDPPAGEEALLDLVNTPITVASSRPMTQRESPGIVTCLTREEIQSSGARDLLDLLRFVPGLDAAYDNAGATGLSARGLWAYEGKVLVLWDGVELTELLNGTLALGHRLPLEQIRRIEIIRGPGSVKYGGSAELLVIRITSLDAEDLDGPALALTAGRSRGSYLRRSASLMYGAGSASGLQVSGGLYDDHGLRSAEPWVDTAQTPRDASLNSEMKSRLAHLGVSWKGLVFRAFLDDYTVQDPIYRPSQPQQHYESSSQNFSLSYVWKLAPGLSLTPFATYRRDSPLQRIITPRPNPLSRTVLRLKGGLKLDWEINPALNLNLGAEALQDDASTAKDTSRSFYLGQNRNLFATYRDQALYSEFTWLGPVNLVAGARWEKHSMAGEAFVPRLALTKALDRWHFKLLYAEAFRSPAALHFRTSSAVPPSIKPERTLTWEGEAGLRMGAQTLSLNLFSTRLKDPIVDVGSRVYNGPRTGSRGAELEYRLRADWGMLDLNYSYARAWGNEVSKWSVPGLDDRFLAFPAHKTSAILRLPLGKGFRADASCIWRGSRYGYDMTPGVSRAVLHRFEPDLLVNLQVAWTWRALELDLGVADLGDRAAAWLQAYAGGLAPLPEGGREVLVRMRYGF